MNYNTNASILSAITEESLIFDSIVQPYMHNANKAELVSISLRSYLPASRFMAKKQLAIFKHNKYLCKNF